MSKTILILAVALMLSGCVQTMYNQGPAVTTITPQAIFKAEEAQHIKTSGNNTIKGEAFLKTQGGDVKTCAGNKVTLMPITAYATERITYLCGKVNDAGYIGAYASTKVAFASTDQGFLDHMKTTFCDSTGRFIFENIANGDYYIETTVTWLGGYPSTTQGGSLVQKVNVSNGQALHVFVLGK